MATTPNMGLSPLGNSTQNQTTVGSRNNDKIDAHDHTAGKGASITAAVLAIIDANPDDVADSLVDSTVGSVYSILQAADQTIGAVTALVPFATVLDERGDDAHFTSAAALTGTVAKTASSAAVVGTGTLFTTELTVGQVISIPGTSAEKAVVTAIADNTHLTLSVAMAHTATGQTATRVNTAWVCRIPGTFIGVMASRMTHVSAGYRTIRGLVNSVEIPGAVKKVAIGGTVDLAETITFVLTCALWDVVEMEIGSDEASSPFVGPTMSMVFQGAA